MRKTATMKITKDARKEMNGNEKKEFLKRECPICGKATEPYCSLQWFKTTYFYKCNEYAFRSNETEGCGSRWQIKFSKKNFVRKIKKRR